MSLAGFAFVDDTDTGTAARPGESTTSLLNRAQTLILKWGESLELTGGALEPSKSDVTVVQFADDERLPKYLTVDASLQMRAPDGQLQALKSVAPTEGRMTLGVMIAADGTQTDQLEYMTKKSESWAERMRIGHLPRHVSWHALKTTILKTLGYPLASTCLSEDQCTKALSPALRRGLAASGIVRNIDRRIVHAPQHLQGLGLPSLYDLQGYEHIKRILNDGPAETITGKLIRLNLELTKIETGLGGNVFDTDYSKVEGWIPRSWITNTWKYLSEAKLRLVEGTPIMPLLREGDSYIMEKILSLRFFSVSELISINYCRKFLGVFNLADLATADGKALRSNCYLHPDRYIRHREISWKCPHDAPKSSEWSLWKLALQKTFLSHLSGQPLMLASPLGRWNLDMQHWFWFYSEQQQKVFQRIGKKFGTYQLVDTTTTRTLRHTSSTFAKEKGTIELLPVDSVMATVELYDGFLTLSGIDTIAVCPPPTNNDTITEGSISQVLNNWPVEKQWFFKQCAFPPDNGKALAEAISSGTTCIGVADGSFKSPMSAASFSLASPLIPRQLHLIGSTPTPGKSSDQSPYRAELTGLLAVLLSVEIICKVHRISSGSIKVSCDNDIALNWVLGSSTLTCETPDGDIIHSARQVLSHLSVTCEPVVVKGHKDDEIPFEKLPFLNQQNVLVDNLAKLFRNNLLKHRYKPRHRPLPHHEKMWSIYIDSDPIFSNFQSKILYHRSIQSRLLQLQEKGFSNQAFRLTDWEAMGLAISSLPLSRQHWILKHASGRSSIGVEMLRRKEWQTDSCPRCSRQETVTHLPQCSSTSATNIWKNFIELLPDWLESNQTHPGITEVLPLYLQRWHSTLPFPSQPLIETAPDIQEALADQTIIGWDNFFLGRCALQLTEIQQIYASDHGLKRSGTRWMAALIKHVWGFLRDQWDDRNDILHANTIADERKGLHDLKREVQNEYERGITNFMLPEEKSLWQCTKTNLLNRPAPLLRSWLGKARAARSTANFRFSNGTYKGERAALASWLGRP